jgi:PAS domain S-box-containing protein
MKSQFDYPEPPLFLQSPLTHIGIFELSSDAVIAMDKHLYYTYLNKKAGELLHLDPAYLVGKWIWNVFPDAIGSDVYQAFNKATVEQKNSTLTAYYPPFDLWLDYHLYPSPEGLSVVIRNVTEQTKSSKEITDYKHALNQSSIISVTDQNGIITHVNENFCKNSKFSEFELIGQDHRILNSGYHSNAFMEDLRATIAAGKIWKGEICNKAKDGSLYWEDTTIFPFLNENKRPYEYLAIRADITERKNKEIELQDVRDEERAEMAREIHDELGQQLTGIKMDLSWISKKMPIQEDNEVRLKVNGTLDLLDATIRTVRKIATELRPGILYDLGLVAAIKWQAVEFQKRSGIPTNFISNLPEFNGSPTVAIGLFRICQESLTNIARYAEANNVAVTLQENEDNALSLVIADDGKGFHPDRVGRTKKTLGLLGMKERTIMMGGEFGIASEPGGGTIISVTIPSSIS